jgi:hypothetical protein
VKKSSRPTSAAKPPQSHERAARSKSRDDRTPRHVRLDKLADDLTGMASAVYLPICTLFPLYPLYHHRLY